jgi:hypothetical protein
MAKPMRSHGEAVKQSADTCLAQGTMDLLFTPTIESYLNGMLMLITVATGIPYIQEI